MGTGNVIIQGVNMDWRSIGWAILGLIMYKLFGIWPLVIVLAYAAFVYFKDKKKIKTNVETVTPMPVAIPTKHED
jgi:hypothetical protein